MSKRRVPLSQVLDTTNKRKRVDDFNCSKISDLRVGSILKIVVKNFMCHDLLEVAFDNNLNFIIGRNGSGKSAILTALILGLGGRAAMTNRGNSIKAFIKTGCKSAVISIWLKNDHPMGYKNIVYGDVIVIERTISNTGTTTYRVKSQDGRMVNTKVREVENILVNLNIQIDNPVSILNQDTARNFLNSSDATARYDLFNRATQLETLYNEYKQGIARWKKAKSVFAEKEVAFNELIKEIEQLHQKIENHKNLQAIKVKVSELHKELLWSKVSDSEKAMVEKQKELEELQEKYKAAMANIETRDKDIAEILERIAEIDQKINEMAGALRTQSEAVQKIVQEIDAVKSKLMQKKREETLVMNSIERKVKERDNIQKEIDNFTSKMDENQRKQLKRQRDIQECQDKLKELKSMADTFENEIFQHSNEVTRKEDSLQQVLNELESAKSKFNRTQDSVTMLQENASNATAIYGRNVNRLLDAIKGVQGKFSKLPRGPLGAYVTVNDKKWALAVETYLGIGTLYSFCVNSDKDYRILYDLMNQIWDPHSTKPAIITTKFFENIHDVSPYKVQRPEGCACLYDMITVTDPIVMNCLIDQNRIENVLLIPDIERAQALLTEAANVPRNCTTALTVQGHQFYPDPSYRFYSCKSQRTRFLQVNNAEALRSYGRLLKEQEQAKNELQVRHTELRGELQQRRIELKRMQTKTDECKQMQNNVKKKMAQLQSELEDEDVYNVQQLDDEIQEINRNIEQLNEQIDKTKETISMLKEQQQEKEDTLVKTKEARKLLEERVLSFQEQKKEKNRLRGELDINGEHDKRREHQYKRKIKEANAQTADLQRTLDLQVQQAQYMGERVDNLRPVPEIAEELEVLQRALRVESEANEDPEKLLQLYTERVNLQRDLNDMMECISESITELNRAYDVRKRRYVTTRDYFENFTTYCFNKFLKTRSFKGSLKIDFNTKTLDLVVLPHADSAGLTAARNLSGGERSFSTVAFLYSLWQVLDFPFYFLDEFDVFMDKANRTKVMEILILHAKQHKNTQFVFFTPQDMPFVNDTEVNVLRLADPERRFTQ